MFISHKLSFSFDPQSLKADLARVLDTDWVAHFNRAYYEGVWKGLALRSTSGRANQLHTPPNETAEALETPVLTRCPYFQQVFAAFNCPIHTGGCSVSVRVPGFLSTRMMISEVTASYCAFTSQSQPTSALSISLAATDL
jgi:hypothetical protein